MIASAKYFLWPIPPECSLYWQDLRFRSCQWRLRQLVCDFV